MPLDLSLPRRTRGDAAATGPTPDSYRDISPGSPVEMLLDLSLPRTRREDPATTVPTPDSYGNIPLSDLLPTADEFAAAHGLLLLMRSPPPVAAAVERQMLQPEEAEPLPSTSGVGGGMMMTMRRMSSSPESESARNLGPSPGDHFLRSPRDDVQHEDQQQKPSVAAASGSESPTSTSDRGGTEEASTSEVPPGTSGSLSPPEAAASVLEHPAIPSSSHASSSTGGSPSSMDHPFCHLPRVLPGEIHRRFNPQRALMPMIAPRYLAPLCLQVHDIFLRETVTPTGVEWVIKLTEEVVSHGIYKQRRPLDRLIPSVAVSMLGRRFLLFELVLSVFQLMGETPSGPWWETLKNSVPHIYKSDDRLSSDQPSLFNLKLIQDLSNALEIMKSGRRPPNDQIIYLKRQLFCLPSSPRQFQAPIWNAWREDDARFRQQQQRGGSDGAQT